MTRSAAEDDEEPPHKREHEQQEEQEQLQQQLENRHEDQRLVLQLDPCERSPDVWNSDFAVVLPPELQEALVHDAHQAASKEQARQPVVPTLKELLEAYSRSMYVVAARTPLLPVAPDEPAAATVALAASSGITVRTDDYKCLVKTLRALYNAYCFPCLLYPSEKELHRRLGRSRVPRGNLTTCYPCGHLLRLVVALPMLAALAGAQLDQNAKPVFIAHLQHMLHWLVKRKRRFFPCFLQPRSDDE